MAPFAQHAAALRHRDFRLLVAAFLLSGTGLWASGVVLDVYVFSVTGSLGWVAAMVVATLVPGLLAAPVAGLLADRHDRRTVAIVSAALTAAASGIAAVGVAVHAPVVLLLVVAALGAVARSPYRPATGALNPEVVDAATLPAATAIIGALENVVVVLGPAVGGLLLLLRAPAVGPALAAVCWAGAAVIAWALAVRSRGEVVAGEAALHAVLAGVKALRSAPTAGVLLGFAALDAVLANAYPVLYLPISGRLGLGTDGYGWLLVGAAAGGVGGAVLADRLSSSARIAPVIVGGIAVQALPYAATAFTRAGAVGIGLQVVSGAGEIMVDVLALLAIQREVPGGALSRVLSLLDGTVLLASAAGSVGASALLGALPLDTALLVIGLGFTAVALALAPLVLRADRDRIAERGRTCVSAA